MEQPGCPRCGQDMEFVPSWRCAQCPSPEFDPRAAAGTETAQALREAQQLLFAIAVNQCSGAMKGTQLLGTSGGKPLWAWLLRHLAHVGRFRITYQNAVGLVKGHFLFGGEDMHKAETPPRRKGSALRSAEVDYRQRKAAR